MEGPSPTLTPTSASTSNPSNFRKFFLRGVGILLPSVLTIWILIAGYQFVQSYIAQPINAGVRGVLLVVSPWPTVSEQALDRHRQEVLARRPEVYRDRGEAWLRTDLRRIQLAEWWQRYNLLLDLIGLATAIVLIYGAGLLVGSLIGRRLHERGERILQRLPLIGRVYPAVKQVTDFFVGDHPARMNFNRVVAVEYPRKGLWSVGLVTGSTMRMIQDRAGTECLTVFVPSSPTPFTGYVITVPINDTIDLPINIEDAIKFSLSAGVLIPPNQVIEQFVGQTITTADGRSHAAPAPDRPTPQPAESLEMISTGRTAPTTTATANASGTTTDTATDTTTSPQCGSDAPTDSEQESQSKSERL